MAAARPVTKRKWSMLGAIGWEVWLPCEEGSGGASFPVVAWAWSPSGEVRAVACGNKGPFLLSKREQAEGKFQMVRIA
jgi:hypothetical protein